jgi:hypothetical protein
MPKRIVCVQDKKAAQPVMAEQKDESYELKFGSMYPQTSWTTVWLTCIASPAAKLIEKDGKVFADIFGGECSLHKMR